MGMRILILFSFILNSIMPAAYGANSGLYNGRTRKEPLQAMVDKRVQELGVQANEIKPLSDKDLSKAVTGSVFKSCENVVLLDNDEYKKNSNYWLKAEKECEAQTGDIQLLPETGFFTLSMNEANGTPVKADEFLKRVGGRTVRYLEQNYAFLGELEQCFAQAQPSSDCIDKKHKVRHLVKDTLPELREKLALVGSSTTVGNFNDIEYAIRNQDGSRFVNRKLGSGGGLLGGGALVAEDNAPLSDVEVQKATRAWNKVLAEAMLKYKTKIEKEIAEAKARNYKPDSAVAVANDYEISLLKRKLEPSNESYKRFIMHELMAASKKHISEYHAVLQKAPVMAYVTDPYRDDGNYLVSIKKLRENAKEEKERLNKILAKGNKDDMLEFMKNVPVMEEILAEDSRVCATAQGLVNYVASKDTRHAVGIMAGMLAFGLGATVGLASIPFRGAALMSAAGAANTGAILGSGAGFSMTALHQQDVNRVERQAFSRVGTDQEKAVASVDRVAQEKDGMVLDYALAPANLIGLGFIGRGVNKAASVGMLRMQGLESAEAKKLVQLAASEDKVIAQQARKTLDEQTGKFWKDLFGRAPNKDEQLLIDTAASKSFDKKVYAEELARRVNRLSNAAEKRAFIRDVTAALNKLDASKLNDLNRMDVLKNISAAGKLGMKDPERVAGLINDWTAEGTAGINGLTKTYELAASKLQLEGAKLTGKSQAEKVEYAFSSAIREQIDNHPNLKGLSKAEKDGMVAKMCVCPGMCPAK